MDEQNLLQETLEEMASHQKQPQDVQWVGTNDGARSISWEQFATMAQGINYDSGYGAREIPSELIVVGSDWWLERNDQGGSEWWEFKSLPTREEQSTPFTLIARNLGFMAEWSISSEQS